MTFQDDPEQTSERVWLGLMARQCQNHLQVDAFERLEAPLHVGDARSDHLRHVAAEHLEECDSCRSLHVAWVIGHVCGEKAVASEARLLRLLRHPERMVRLAACFAVPDLRLYTDEVVAALLDARDRSGSDHLLAEAVALGLSSWEDSADSAAPWRRLAASLQKFESSAGVSGLAAGVSSQAEYHDEACDIGAWDEGGDLIFRVSSYDTSLRNTRIRVMPFDKVLVLDMDAGHQVGGEIRVSRRERQGFSVRELVRLEVEQRREY